MAAPGHSTGSEIGIAQALLRRGLLLALVIASSLAACREGDPEREKMEKGTNDAANATIGDTPVRDAPSVDITVTEDAIAFPASLPRGAHLLRIINNGTQEHNVIIEGMGAQLALPTNIQPGETKTLPANLEAGSYRVYCSLGHQHGAEGSLNVTP